MRFTSSPRHPEFARLLPRAVGLSILLGGLPLHAYENVFLTGVPDYEWHMGCFGTACGNLIGFWDRHGFPDHYTGRTAAGVAPLNSFGSNEGIRGLWASQAGIDGRPLTQPGHVDDYYRAYESTGPDPYLASQRPEHTPDCIGDFIGLSQLKWSDLAGECRGNIDAYSFNFFDRDGRRRDNHTPTDSAGQPIPDLQSGLRAWTESRGYAADTFSQLSDFNPDKPPGLGFSFADLKAEIDAGYPVLLFMQPFGSFARTLGDQSGLNPEIHGMLAYGYLVDESGNEYVRYRTSWASGDREFSPWTADDWTPEQALNLPLRGVIGYHPRPKITRIDPAPDGVRLEWDGPSAVLRDDVLGVEIPVHRYVVERAPEPNGSTWLPVTEPSPSRSATVPGCCEGPAFFRVRLVTGI